MVVGGSLSKNKGGKLHSIWSNGKETSLTVNHNAGYITWGDLHLQVKELGGRGADRHLRAGKWPYEIAMEK